MILTLKDLKGHKMTSKRTQTDQIEFLEDKIGIPKSKEIEEMSRLDLNKISIKEKNDRIMNRSKKRSHITQKFNNKNSETKDFHSDRDLFVGAIS